MIHSPRITHKRRLVQGLLIIVALLLPCISISGNPFLRMHIAGMTLFMAGISLRIDPTAAVTVSP